MSDDALPLQTAWMSGEAAGQADVRTAASLVLQKDRADRLRERRLQMAGLAVLVLLVPVVIWAAAHGVSPLVRGAYALMAAGCVAVVVAEWLYLEWSRRALPGSADTRAQLERTAFMLECQDWLARTAVLWTAPVFIGGVLISVWLFRERTAAGAATVFALIMTAWIGSGILTARAAAAFGRRRRQLEDVLADLRDDAPGA